MSKKNLNNNVRLLTQELTGIIAAVESVAKKKNLSLRGCLLSLYGSRTDLLKCGGDIDLVFEVPKSILSLYSELEVPLLIAIKGNIGEQKIDFLIRDKLALPTEFEAVALQNKVLLKQW